LKTKNKKMMEDDKTRHVLQIASLIEFAPQFSDFVCENASKTEINLRDVFSHFVWPIIIDASRPSSMQQLRDAVCPLMDLSNRRILLFSTEGAERKC
jgi:Na+-transporting NADH:ubiquinone oxidoreductase subunit NqrC